MLLYFLQVYSSALLLYIGIKIPFDKYNSIYGHFYRAFIQNCFIRFYIMTNIANLYK